jgi:hypothetical protein
MFVYIAGFIFSVIIAIHLVKSLRKHYKSDNWKKTL